MIRFSVSAEIPADRRVELSVPPDTPVGKADLVVTIVPQGDVDSSRGTLRARFGTVHSGDPRSADNDQIDADVAREYGDNV